MMTADIARIAAEVMVSIIVIAYMMEQMDQEVITPAQEAAQVAQAERFGSSISSLSLSAMVSMSYSGQSY